MLHKISFKAEENPKKVTRHSRRRDWFTENIYPKYSTNKWRLTKEFPETSVSQSLCTDVMFSKFVTQYPEVCNWRVAHYLNQELIGTPARFKVQVLAVEFVAVQQYKISCVLYWALWSTNSITSSGHICTTSPQQIVEIHTSSGAEVQIKDADSVEIIICCHII